MTWLPLTFSLLMVAIVAVPLLLLPLMSRSVAPFGVTVLVAHELDDAVAHARQRYAQLAVAVIAIAIVVAWLLSPYAVVGMLVPTLICALGLMASYAWVRRSIVKAQKDAGGYAETSTRASGASLSAGAARPRFQWGWYAASLVLLATGFTVGAIRYPLLPDPMPVHWGLEGQPDRFDPKSFISAFLPLLVTLALVVLLAATAWRLPANANRAADARARQTDATATHGRKAAKRGGELRRLTFARGPGFAQNAQQQHATLGILGALTLTVTAMLTGSSVAAWLDPQSEALNAFRITGIALIAVVLFAGVWLYVQSSREDAANAPAADSRVSASAKRPNNSRTGDTDREKHWKGGVFYANHDDPALFVRKRIGNGWTLNLGRRAAWLLIAAVIVLIAVALIVPSSLTA